MSSPFEHNGADQEHPEKQPFIDQIEHKTNPDTVESALKEIPRVTKTSSIARAIERNDLDRLCELAAQPGGFLEDSIRRRAWPLLLGSSSTSASSDEWKTLKEHRDEHQVDLDVNRAFVYYPREETEDQLGARRQALTELIVSTLRSHEGLSYFQGFHDIAQVLLLVLGLPTAQAALPRLSLLRIRDFMLPTIAGTRSHLELIPAILMAADPQLCLHLKGLQSFFALSATLTMFAHDIEEYGGIARLFDYLLARPAVVSVYMFAAIVSLRRDELLELDAEEPEMLYAVLSKLPKPLDLDALIHRTEALRSKYPPQKLPFRRWSTVSKWSVLKTTEPLDKLKTQTVSDGEQWLQWQAADIERQEEIRKQLRQIKGIVLKHRRVVSLVSVTIFVGVLSIYLGRNGSSSINSYALFASRSSHIILNSINRWLTGRS